MTMAKKKKYISAGIPSNWGKTKPKKKNKVKLVTTTTKGGVIGPATTPKPATPVTPRPAAPTAPVYTYQNMGMGNRTPEAINKRYDDQYAAEKARQEGVAASQIQAANADADRVQNANYINYMMAQKAMPEQLARLGVNGGASESSLIRANTNYATMRGRAETDRANQISKINSNLSNGLAEYKATSDKNRNDEITAAETDFYNRVQADKRFREEQRQFDEQQAASQKNADREYALKKAEIKQNKSDSKWNRKMEKLKFKDNKMNNKYKIMSDEVSKYGDVKSVNKAIRSAKAAMKNASGSRKTALKTKIALLKGQRSAIKGKYNDATQEVKNSIKLWKATSGKNANSSSGSNKSNKTNKKNANSSSSSNKTNKTNKTNGKKNKSKKKK